MMFTPTIDRNRDAAKLVLAEEFWLKRTGAGRRWDSGYHSKQFARRLIDHSNRNIPRWAKFNRTIRTIGSTTCDESALSDHQRPTSTPIGKDVRQLCRREGQTKVDDLALNLQPAASTRSTDSFTSMNTTARSSVCQNRRWRSGTRLGPH